MKRNVIIISACVIIGLIVCLFLFLHNDEISISMKLIKTNSIVASKLFENDEFEEKKITNSNNVKEIIKIIKKRKKMSKNVTIPYRKIPHYKLKFLDNHDSIIYEVNFFYYSADSTWISFGEDNSYYIIDSTSLLKILNF